MAEDVSPARSPSDSANGSSDDLYRVLFAGTPTPFLVLTPDPPRFTILEVNDAYLQVTMSDRASIIGRGVFEAFPDNPDDPEATGTERLRASLERVLDSREPDAMAIQKYDVRGPDGTFVERYWSPLNAPILNDEGEIEAIIHRVEDVTAYAVGGKQSSARFERLESEVLAAGRRVQHANDELRGSEARLNLIIDAASDYAIFTTDPQHRITSWSGGAEAIFGYSAQEAIGMDADVLWTPEDRNAQRPSIEAEQANSTGCSNDERWHQRKDGSRVFLNGSVHPLPPNEDGSERGLIKIARDETKRRAAERELHDKEERLRLAVDNAEIGFWDVEEGHGNLIWPPRTKAMFGISADKPVTMDDFYAGLHPDDLPRVAEAFAAAADPGRRALYDVDYRTIGKEDGVIRWVAAKGRGIFDSEGPDARCLRVVGTAIDITERKATERALREESHNLEILNRTGAAVAAELDLERVVQMVTDAGVELTGAHFGAFFYNVVDDTGESYTLYTISGVPRSEFERFPMPRNTKVFGPTFAGECVVRSDDITRDPRYGHNAPYHGMPKGHLPVVSYLAVPVTSRTGDVVGGLFFGHPEPARFQERHERLMVGIAAQAAIAIDNATLFRAAQHEIDRRVNAEAALTALNETLESRVAEEIKQRSRAEDVLRQAQKMETVGQLSGGIAHDFNNLLQIIHGYLSLLEREIPENEARQRRAVVNALSGTERAAALTQRLLAFSRRQPLSPRSVDVNRLITDMTELLHRTLAESIAVETRLPAELPNAFVDANQLENAILNLAVNARDAMPAGGRLEIRTTVCDIAPGDLPGSEEAAPGCYVCIAVRDTGHGMSPEVLERAVEPFFSTKEVGQGTGLGLSTVYGFVRQSGGYLRLESSEGTGTTIELCLPVASEAEGTDPISKPANAMPRGNGERILLCEDDEGVRSFSAETLRELGYEVIEAGDAAEALAAFGRGEAVDMLFTDVVLPGGKTGADLAREARVLRPDLKVLFTTGYARSALDSATDGGKQVDLLLKPFGVEQLAAKMRKVLG